MAGLPAGTTMFSTWFFLAVGVLVPPAVCAIGLWVVLPVEAAARHRQLPIQFSMLDFLALTFLCQLPLALSLVVFNRDEPLLRWTLTLLGWAGCAVAWSKGVRMLSAAGIRSPWKRGLFLGFVLPTACFGPVAFALIALAIPHSLGERANRLWGLPSLVAAEGVLVACFAAAGRWTRRMIPNRDSMEIAGGEVETTSSSRVTEVDKGDDIPDGPLRGVEAGR